MGTQTCASGADGRDKNNRLEEIPWNCPQALLNEHQVAEVLGLSVKSLRRWRAAGAGPRFIKVNGFSVRYAVGSLLVWLNQQPQGGADVPPAARRAGRPWRADSEAQ